MIMRNQILTLASLSLLTVTGCVAAWGGAYNVALANEGGITIEFDPLVISIPEISAIAQEHCSKIGRNALLDNQGDGNLGIKVNTYRCV